MDASSSSSGIETATSPAVSTRPPATTCGGIDTARGIDVARGNIESAHGAAVSTSTGIASFSRSGRYHRPQPFPFRVGAPTRASSNSRSAFPFLTTSAINKMATRCATHTNAATANPARSMVHTSTAPTATIACVCTSSGSIMAKVMEFSAAPTLESSMSGNTRA